MKRSEFVAQGAGATIALTLPRSPQTPSSGRLQIRRLHWAGVSLVMDDAQLFIDPVTENPTDPAPKPEVGNSFAVVSHHHNDHFDPANLALAVGKNGFVAMEESIGNWADTRTLPVQKVPMYQPVMMPRGKAVFCAIPVPAVDGLGAPQTSWVIDAQGIRVLHLGDTQWHGGFWDIARAYGPFDLMFLPINGFQQVAGRYREVGQPMSLSPAQAASAVELFRPTIAVPIHYGEPSPPTYLEADRPLETFLSLTKSSKSRIVALQQGDRLSLTRGA
jgi:L-ascorbate metabolism protein UlaG (beta-lactamase superfamily)